MSDYQQAPMAPQDQGRTSDSGPVFDEREYQRRQDDDHLKILAIFHYIMGGLMVLGCLYGLVYAGFGAVMLAAPGTHQGGSDPSPLAMGYMFIAMGTVIVLICAALSFFTIRAGMDLVARRGLMLIQVMACINCLSIPVGTILGVFTLVVLNRPTVRALFERQKSLGESNAVSAMHPPSYYDR